MKKMPVRNVLAIAILIASAMCVAVIYAIFAVNPADTTRPLATRPNATRLSQSSTSAQMANTIMMFKPAAPATVYASGFGSMVSGSSVPFDRHNLLSHAECGKSLDEADSLLETHPSDAFALYNHVLQLDPNIPRALYGLGDCEEALTGDSAEAAKYYRRAL